MSEGNPRVPELEPEAMREYAGAPASSTSTSSAPSSGCGCVPVLAAPAGAPAAPAAASDPTITISITPTTGGQFYIVVDKNESIENLKKIISKRLKVAKERICLLHRERQLRDGTLEENRLQDGSQLTLLPSVETGLLAQRPEQSVMQALESLSDSQVNDFLSGKAPLNLTMRLGDHMMLIQLQLSTVTPATGTTTGANAAGNSAAGRSTSPGAGQQLNAEMPRSHLPHTYPPSPDAPRGPTVGPVRSFLATSPTASEPSSPRSGGSSPRSPPVQPVQPIQLQPPQSPPQSQQSTTNSSPPKTPPATRPPPPLPLQHRHPARHRHLHPTRHPYIDHYHHLHQRYIRKISQVVKPSCPSCNEAEAAAAAAAAAAAEPAAPAAKCSEFSLIVGQCECSKSPKKKVCGNAGCSGHGSPQESGSSSQQLSSPGAEACAATTTTTTTSAPSTPTNPDSPDVTVADPVGNPTATLDTRALVEASRNLTQKLKQLSSEENAKRRQGAIIESMHHHGKGVYTGTFSGTLNPALQDRHGRPKRDISTIIHILNDLLCATPATTAGHYRYHRHPNAHRAGSAAAGASSSASASSTSSSAASSSASASQSSSMFTMASNGPAASTTASGTLESAMTCPVSPTPGYSSEELSKENEATKGKMRRLRLVMEQRREKMRARRQARAAPYTTKWAAVTPDPNPDASTSSTGSPSSAGKSSSDPQNEPELQPCSPEPVVA